MAWNARILLLLFLLCGGCSTIDDRASPVTAYTNGLWWSEDRFAPGDRWVRDGVFVDRPSRPAAASVDLGGEYVVPPFGEAHNHITGSSNNVAFLTAGIFYVQNPNILASVTSDLKPFYARPNTIDGTMAMGGLTGPGGHPVPLYTVNLREYVYTDMTAEQMFGDAFHVIATPDDIVPALATLQRQGADFIKIYLLYSERFELSRAKGDTESTGLDPAFVPEIVRQAHARGWKVMAHVETAADFRVAVRAGVDELAHLPGYAASGDDFAPYALTKDDAQAAARTKLAVVATGWIGALSAKDDAARLAEVRALHRANVKLLNEAGVTVLMGSDGGPADAVAEAIYLTEIGALTPLEAFRSLAIDTPRSIFPKRRIAAFKRGYEASFLTLPADPTRDISAVQRVQRRVMAGLPVDVPPPPARPAP